MSRNIEEKIVFAVGPSASGKPVLLFGIPKAAWDYMKDGKTHTFDLTSLGIPVQMIMYGADNHSAALKVIEDHCKHNNVPLLDERRRDFSVKT